MSYELKPHMRKNIYSSTTVVFYARLQIIVLDICKERFRFKVNILIVTYNIV